MSTIREEVRELMYERESVLFKVKSIESKLSAIRSNCNHNNVEKGREYEIDKQVEERGLTCLDCCHRWREQKDVYDEHWPYDLGERGEC